MSEFPLTIAALEKLLVKFSGKYATGDEVFLVCPRLYIEPPDAVKMLGYESLTLSDSS